MVRILDCKTWRSRVKWRAPNKFDIVKILPGPTAPGMLPLYLTGRDNEVLLCNVQLPAKQQDQRQGHRQVMASGQDRDHHEEIPASKKARVERETLHHTELPSASKLRMSHHRLAFRYSHGGSGIISGVSNITSTEECELNFSGQGWMCTRLFRTMVGTIALHW